MKKICTLLLVSFIIQLINAQDYPDLLIDSIHYDRQSIESSTGMITSSFDFTAYSYDDEDLLTQTRKPTIINSYSYSPNEIIINSERINNDGTLETIGRTTRILEEGRVINTKNELFNNGVWTNLIMETTVYNTEGYDSLNVTQVWSNDDWKILNQREKGFDVEGNIIKEENYSYNDDLEELEPSNGYLATYDQNGKISTRTTMTANSSMEFELSEFTDYIRDSEGLLSMVTECAYDGNGDCIFTNRTTYDRTALESYTVSYFNRSGTDWDKWRSRIYFYGPQVYSSQPDSSLIYNFSSDTPEDSLLFIRYYYNYELLPDGRLFNKIEFYKLDLDFDNGWVKESENHLFYWIRALTNIDEPTEKETGVSIYPNPVKSGGLLNIDLPTDFNGINDVEVYDFSGRMVMSAKMERGMTLLAPPEEGIYLIQIKKDGVLIESKKQVVIR